LDVVADYGVEGEIARSRGGERVELHAAGVGKGEIGR
jgi:hypothetical protein